MAAGVPGLDNLPLVDVLLLDQGGIVVVPSVDYHPLRYEPTPGVEYLEERMLFVLLWLARPGFRIAYVTSLALDEALVDNYMRFLPDPEEAASRLELVALNDPRRVPLSRKLLERPDVTARLRGLAADAGPTWLVPFKVTEDEVELSRVLALPLYGPSRDVLYLGTKSGGRLVGHLAKACVPAGSENLRTMREVEESVNALLVRKHGMNGIMVKLNNGIGGLGNATIRRPRPLVPVRSTETAFGSSLHTWDSFEKEIEGQGAVVEELIMGDPLASPSVQMIISPDGTLREFSQHDQILGGPQMQKYKACTFPARKEYRTPIRELASDVGEVLASLGVIGFFSLDFLVCRDRPLRPYLCEINLRMSATTLPRIVTQELAGAHYDETTGDLIGGGRPKFYMATDNLVSDNYVGLSPKDVVQELRSAGLHYSRNLSTGVMPHMLGALGPHGRLGVTCIANSSREAGELYAELRSFLDRLASLRRRAAS